MGVQRIPRGVFVGPRQSRFQTGESDGAKYLRNVWDIGDGREGCRQQKRGGKLGLQELAPHDSHFLTRSPQSTGPTLDSHTDLDTLRTGAFYYQAPDELFPESTIDEVQPVVRRCQGAGSRLILR